MNKLRLSAFCFLLSALVLSAANVVFPLQNITTQPANRKVLVVPRWMNPTNAVGVLDQEMYRSNTNGSFTITNMPAGIYDCVVQAPPSRTAFSILVVNTNATLYAQDILIVSTNATESPNSYAWSTTASDARYEPIGGDGGWVEGDPLASLQIGPAVSTNRLLLSGAGITNLNGWYNRTSPTSWLQESGTNIIEPGDYGWRIVYNEFAVYESTDLLGWIDSFSNPPAPTGQYDTNGPGWFNFNGDSRTNWPVFEPTDISGEMLLSVGDGPGSSDAFSLSLQNRTLYDNTLTATLDWASRSLIDSWTVTGALTATNFIWSSPRWVDALAAGANLATSPTEAPHLVALPGSSISYGMAYDHGDIAYFTIQSPHVLSSTNDTFRSFFYEPHLHVSPTTIASGTNITFKMEWQEAIVNGNFTNVVTYRRTNSVTATSVNNHRIISFGNVTNNDLAAKSSVIFRGAISRLPSASGDVGDAENVIVDSIDFHVPVRVLGSATQTSDE